MATDKLFNLTITKVDAPVFSGEVVSVQVPGVAGEMEILADHTALISPLKEGIITIKQPDETKTTHQIKQGTLEVAHNHATILI